jgi:Xaa-Pro aminopeptidase
MDKILDRIKNLRGSMANENLDAFYISGTDPHMNEYLPDRWKTREYMTGFTGSFGEVVFTKTEAFLWTDTRYFIQAENQLKGTGIKMMKLRVPDAVPVDQWLAQNLKPGAKVGTDPNCLSFSTYKTLKQALEEPKIELVFCSDLLDKIWENRPPVPQNEVFNFDIEFAGKARGEKFRLITEKLESVGADFQIITALDDLAWTFNLRGSDISYNPVFIGFGLVGSGIKALFVDSQKMRERLFLTLKNEGIELLDYDRFYGYLEKISGKRIYLDPGTTNYAVVKSICSDCKIIEGVSIPAQLKARKNTIELQGIRKAMQKDGVALVKFLRWIKNSFGKTSVSEYSAGRKLAEFRAEDYGFKGESFPPIVGYKGHGAIVHLSVGEDEAYKIEPDGFLLFDSGGHYFEGTTDITRTIALGNLTKEQKSDFTLVLKGMIALSEAKFPYGTKGCNLDILARKALWEHGLNYGHGTGHGVGFFLSVHEGPASIRQEYNSVNLEPGMVFSNEPGLYREGLYGIRTENMIVCVEKEESQFGRFLGFETLSLCPIDISAIDQKMLTLLEKEWLNSYHQKVKQELTSLLSPELGLFLKEITPFVE